jgi:hypothetical protein
MHNSISDFIMKSLIVQAWALGDPERQRVLGPLTPGAGPAMPASAATVTPAAARMHVSARLTDAETAPGGAGNPAPARVIVPPS